MATTEEAQRALKSTSRTFSIPIMGLPSPLHEAVMSAYLCLRAIDDIEDDASLPSGEKTTLLREISRKMQSGQPVAFPEDDRLPEVSRRIQEWLDLAPPEIRPRIADSISAMADRMAIWADRGWKVSTREDLDWYTFSVAGAVGLMLSDLWAWSTGTTTNRQQAVAYGRGLQATNILLNRTDDTARGVDFFPAGWTNNEMKAYAVDNLKVADLYTEALPEGAVRDFCRVPLTLAWASIAARDQGQTKLTREQVQQIVAAID